jgi:hypothetical protein
LTETPLTECNRLLQEAITRLNRGEVESAISSLSEARNKIVASFSLTTVKRNEYDVMRQIISLMQCAMLHYFALAKREQFKENNVLTLTYLGHALGISAALDSLLLPLIEKRSKTKYARDEILWLSKLNNLVRETLCKSATEVVGKIEGKEKVGLLKDVERSVAKIIDSVHPNAPRVRKLAINLGRRFEAGDFKQARRIFEFVRDEIQYVYDPTGLEEVQSPETTLKLRAGDCEDQAILLSSLLSAIGFESALIFADTNNDQIPDHVYSAVFIPAAPEYTKPLKRKRLDDGKDLHDWIPLDPSSQDSDFGVIPIQDLQILKLTHVPSQKK